MHLHEEQRHPGHTSLGWRIHMEQKDSTELYICQSSVKDGHYIEYVLTLLQVEVSTW